jgi:signal transduction histidine kinase
VISVDSSISARWLGAARLTAGSFLLCAIAAGLLFWAAPALETLPRLFVFVECVGMVFIACIAVLGRSERLLRMQALPRWLLTGAIAIPTGYFGGHLIALLILDEPISRLVGHGRDYMVAFAFGLVLAAFVLYAAAARDQLAKEAIARSDAQRLATESELRLLRAQLEPHMLFNTLANLRSLVDEDPRQAERMIDQLIVYLRSTHAASRDEVTTLQSEFSQLKAYLDIMSLRMGPRLTYRLDLPAELERTAIPPMLLQPLVENAIKHGLEPKLGAGNIEVRARSVEGSIEVAVDDSGLGLPPQQPASSDDDAGEVCGSGLKNVRDRLQALYGLRASLTLQTRSPCGVHAVVRIPS